MTINSERASKFNSNNQAGLDLKRLSDDQRKWTYRKSCKEIRKQRKGRNVVVQPGGRIVKLRRRNNERTTKFQRKTARILLPTNCNLDEDYNELIQALHKIRSISELSPRISPRIYIDFRAIRTLSTAAALVLAAELDRWNLVSTRGKLKAHDVAEWNPAIYASFLEMGFFDLLDVVETELPPTCKDEAGISFMNFRRGLQPNPKQINDDLTAIIERELKVDLLDLNPAVQEAQLNVSQHAYPRSGPLISTNSRKVNNWWVSASYNSKNREFTVIVFDQGLGIPGTLPKKGLKEQFSGFLNDDARIIELAFDLPRSETGLEYRGRGLQENVRAYIEDHESDGALSVISNKGLYVYMKKAGKITTSGRNERLSLRGTLVEWHVCLEKL